MVVSIDVDHQGGELLELVVAVLFEAFNPADGLLRDEPHLPGHPSHEVLRVRQSEVIRGHQRSSEVIGGTQRGHPSHEVLRVRGDGAAIRGDSRHSEVNSGHSEAIRGHQRSSEALREATRPTKYCAYGAMARPSMAVRGTQR